MMRRSGLAATVLALVLGAIGMGTAWAHESKGPPPAPPAPAAPPAPPAPVDPRRFTPPGIPPAPHVIEWTVYHGQNELKVHDLVGYLYVTPEAREDVAVSVQRRGDSLPAPRIDRSGRKVEVIGGVPHVESCNGSHVRTSRYGRVSYDEAPVVRVRMPLDAVISVSGAVQTRIGPMRSARLAFSGCGDTIFGTVEQRLNLAINGSGDVRGGVVGAAEVAVAGSGDVVLGSVRDGLTVAIAGSGDVHAGRVQDGDVRVFVRGSGDVSLGGGQVGDMTVVVSGSGDVSFAGRAQSLNAVVAGSGDVVVGAVEGSVTRRVMGSGDVIVGR